MSKQEDTRFTVMCAAREKREWEVGMNKSGK